MRKICQLCGYEGENVKLDGTFHCAACGTIVDLRQPDAPYFQPEISVKKKKNIAEPAVFNDSKAAIKSWKKSAHAANFAGFVSSLASWLPVLLWVSVVYLVVQYEFGLPYLYDYEAFFKSLGGEQGIGIWFNDVFVEEYLLTVLILFGIGPVIVDLCSTIRICSISGWILRNSVDYYSLVSGTKKFKKTDRMLLRGGVVSENSPSARNLYITRTVFNIIGWAVKLIFWINYWKFIFASIYGPNADSYRDFVDIAELFLWNEHIITLYVLGIVFWVIKKKINKKISRFRIDTNRPRTQKPSKPVPYNSGKPSNAKSKYKPSTPSYNPPKSSSSKRKYRGAGAELKLAKLMEKRKKNLISALVCMFIIPVLSPIFLICALVNTIQIARLK